MGFGIQNRFLLSAKLVFSGELTALEKRWGRTGYMSLLYQCIHVYTNLVDGSKRIFLKVLTSGSLLVLEATDSSTGVVQTDSGGSGEQGVEWVNKGLGARASQPQLLVRVLVQLLQSDDSLGVHCGM